MLPASVNLSDNDEVSFAGYATTPSPKKKSRTPTSSKPPKKTTKTARFSSTKKMGGETNVSDLLGDDFQDYSKINLVQNENIQLPHIIVHWKDRYLQNRCSAFVWMLSGLSPSDINATILPGGEILRLKMPWPAVMHDAGALTRNQYNNDSSKVVAIESTIKQMKNGFADALVSSNIDLELGMRVEEQFHNERQSGLGSIEKGSKLLRFFKNITRPSKGVVEQIPVLIGKYEMMGIRDNYRNISTADSDYDDGTPPPMPRSSTTVFSFNNQRESVQTSPSPPKRRRQSKISSRPSRGNRRPTSSAGRKRSSASRAESAAATATTPPLPSLNHRSPPKSSFSDPLGHFGRKVASMVPGIIIPHDGEDQDMTENMIDNYFSPHGEGASESMMGADMSEDDDAEE